MADYYDETKRKEIVRIRRLLTTLPEFTEDFFRGVAQNTSTKSRLGYAYDLRVFFTYLCQYNRKLKGKKAEELTIEDLACVGADDIEKFLDYVTYYENENHMFVKNDEKGKSRKLATIRKMFKYFYRRDKIPSNPAELVDMPKIHEKAIIRLEPDEAARLLDEIESGESFTGRQKVDCQKRRLRDLALVTLLLSTGMRVSECVGINIGNLDFEKNGVLVTRKGGNEAMLYFGEEARAALLDYIDERKNMEKPMLEPDDPLFVSSQKKRINVRSVQNLVKKYARIVTHNKKISPHKLRSTYGTNLYRETGDIYLVADVLGHKDVNTTKAHYADMEESRRQSAVKYIKLRGE